MEAESQSTVTSSASDAQALEPAREAFERSNWIEAEALLAAARHTGTLQSQDAERLAVAAHMLGRDDESADAWSSAYQSWLRLGEPVQAARCGFWLGFTMVLRGELARGNGWLGRSRRLLEEGGYDCSERGYFSVSDGVQKLHSGEAADAYPCFVAAADIAERFGDRQLRAMALLGCGQALATAGKVTEATALLDELMISVLAGELAPMMTGLAYCAAITACQDVFDLKRAQEWTRALTHWSASQAGLVPYRSECLIHRCEIMRLRGEWTDAMEEARRAEELLARDAAAGGAYYEQAELHRLCGEFAKAEEAYRLASRSGHNPQPGLALLRLAQNQLEAAAAAVRILLDETGDPVRRSKVLPAYVEIMLAYSDTKAARAAAEELSVMAASVGAPVLEALATHALGAVLLDEGQPREALTELRRAWSRWQALDAPYEAGRVRLLIGLVCRQLGDEDTAEMELDAAAWVFRQLGAAADLARTEALSARHPSRSVGGLTAREIEVLRLVAAGKTNHAIAAELIVSDHTARRHVQNIFAKLGVSSRASATAYAVQHGLV